MAGATWTYIQQLSFSLSDTLLGTPHNDFIGLGDITLGIGSLRIATGEGDLDVVLFLKADDVLATLADQ